MKFLIVFACLFAVVLANYETEVIKKETDVDAEGFSTFVELADHTKFVQQGKLHDGEELIVTGEFEYLSPEGKLIKVTYTADKDGYHPKIEKSN